MLPRLTPAPLPPAPDALGERVGLAPVLARLDRVVFGAADPKAGFAGSLGNLLQDRRLNHEVAIERGVLADECGDLLRSFFRERR